ncbi:MAG: tetratricopeptide repeat protein [Anaerolineales bacterium]|nr:MAG: tetratricopeptide repeat protein [Anaerolineales bacterium]
MTNPYVIGVPITSTKAFYGRKDVFRFVRETLTPRHQNVAVLFGQRRIGKTSTLHQLPDHLADEFHSIFFDFYGRGGQGVDEVLYDLAATIARSLEIPSPSAARFKDDGKYFVENFLPSVYPQLEERKLLMLLDEFDALSGEITPAKGAASTEFFPILQNLVADKTHLAFVFVVGQPIEELPGRFKAIFRQGQYKRVSFLGHEDAVQLIAQPAKDQLQYDAAAIEAILNLTARHPYFIQVMCFEIFNRLWRENRKQVEVDDVQATIDKALETGTGGLVWFWKGVPPAERFILSVVADITTKKITVNKEEIQKSLDQYGIRQFGIEWLQAPDRLVDWEILKQNSAGNYSVAIDLVRRWVAKKHPPQQAKREIDDVSEIAVQQYEKARRFQTRGDLKAAIEHYRTALRSNPNHFGARLGLAQVLYQRGELAQAVDEFEKAFSFDQDKTKGDLIEARLALAESLEREGAPEEATTHYRRVLELSPEDQRVREKLNAFTKKVKREEKVKRPPLPTLLAASIGALVLALAAFFAAKGLSPKPETPTPTQISAVISPTATASPTVTTTPEPSATNTSTIAPTIATPVVVAVTETPTATHTPVPPTPTPTSTETPTPIPPPLPTLTPTPSQTPIPRPLGPLSVWDVVINPKDTKEIYVVVGGERRGIYRTADGGNSWAYIEGRYDTIQCLAIDPKDPQILYAGSWEGILKSTDGGANWKAITAPKESGLPLKEMVHTLAVVPDDPRAVYAGTGSGVYKSLDQGQTWEARNKGMADTPIYNLAIGSRDGKLIYAAGKGAEIWKSIDGGSSPWEKLSCTYCGRGATSLAVHPDNERIVYVGDDATQISKSTDSGHTWELLTPRLQYSDLRISALVIDPKNPDIIYAGTGDRDNLANDGIYKSTDGGKTWKSISAGLPLNPSGRHYSILTIAIDPNDSQIIYAGGYGGLYRSTDGGNSWERL